MSDLTLVQLGKAYDAALEQIAAESFLAFGMQPDDFIQKLQAGNNPGAISTDPDLDGKLRMTLEQAQVFRNRYRIIDAYQNDATGFSAVALRDNDTPNRVVLAVRSTELLNDRTRDVGADLQIFTSGFAFDQILSAEDFLNRVRPQLQPGEKIDLVGHSLSGNIVRTLAAMYPDVINQEAGSHVVFNATGLGEFRDPTGNNRSRDVVLKEMMNLYRQVEANPNNATDVPVHLLPLQWTAIAALPIDRTDPNGNIYSAPQQDFAQAYIQNRYSTTYTDDGIIVAESSFAQYFGVALSGFDPTTVANSGSHPVPIAVPIEGQPVVEIPPLAPRLDYLNTHSLTLMADSLRLQVLFKEIDFSISKDTIQAIFQASSASAANTLLGRAEKDTLENALDAVRRALLPVDQNFQPTPSSDMAGGFGNMVNRTVFHNNITAVENMLPPQPSPYRIEALVNRPLEEVMGNALLEDEAGKGLAYRYALTALNPFAMIGPTYGQHNPNGELALFNPVTGLGTITTDYIQDRGRFLAAKVTLNQANLDGLLNPFALTHYHDNTTGYDIPSGLSIPSGVQREYIFGSDTAETITGGSLFTSDHLYGADGVDILQGFGGDDYLQGDGGNDTLDGGSDADRMIGGQGNDRYIVDHADDQVSEGLNNGSDTVQSSVSFTLGTNLEDLLLAGSRDINGTGNELNNQLTGNSGMNRLESKDGMDHLIGNDGNDVLIGGTGDGDLLEGGIGFDTYFYNAGDGSDRIEDSDARGQIIFNGHRLLGGIHHSNDPLNTYKSLDGLTTYLLSGPNLIVNGVLTVNEHFQSGQFGIELREVVDPNWKNDYPVVIGAESDGFINNILHYSDINDLGFGERGNDQLFGNGGNDILRGWSGNDRVYGGTGDDVLDGDWRLILFNPSAPPFALGTDLYYGDDLVDGGEGNDTLFGSWGDDLLYGGAGNDLLYGDHFLQDRWTFTADDFLDGGEGNDELHGMAGDDVLSGGEGNDTLLGEEDEDVLEGGAGADTLWAGIGNDSLSGGSGVDILLGDFGNDLLDGGSEADSLYGGDGADSLFGGAGNDLLFGDGLNTPEAVGVAGGNDFLDGGEGDDELQGMIGDDYLFGGAGNDFLLGQEGNDTVFGDAGDDVLNGDAGRDSLFGGDGNDGLTGGEGDDAVYGDGGSDTLQGDQGNDVLVGGAGNDIYNFSLGDGQDTITDAAVGVEGNSINFFGGITFESLTFVHDPVQQMLTIQVGGGADSIRLLGFDPNTFQYVVETLRFSDGSFVALANQLLLPGGLVAGTDEANIIRTGSSDDIVFAEAGNDVVYAGDGNDLLVGGEGADVLQGGTGSDQYLFHLGDGADTIVDTANEGNRVVFGDGILLSALTLSLGSGQTLVLALGHPGDQIALSNALTQGMFPVDSFAFADGSTLTVAQLLERGITIAGTPGSDFMTGTNVVDRIFADAGNDVVQAGDGNDVLNGEAGNDSLEGEAGDDVLVGGAGDDQLLGGDGNDIYRFTLGDGLDSLFDAGSSTDMDTVIFGTGIASDALTLAVDAGQIVLKVGTGSDGIYIGNAGDVFGSQTIERFELADGTTVSYADLVASGFTIDGTEFDDVLRGTNAVDRFRGGVGNDRLEGGDGDDSYFFNPGDGVDTIEDTAVAGAGNAIVFGPGISSADISLNVTPDQSDSSLADLLLHVGTHGDAIQLDIFDRQDVFGPRTIETVRFADGSMLTYEQLLARGFDVTGTADHDYLLGTNTSDRIAGLDGADVLRAGSGHDQLDGGAGNDRLFGGEGDDTYVFEPGAGQDSILEFQGSQDRIRMAVGVAPSDVSATRDQHDLVLSLSGGIDRLTVTGYFLAPMLQIERVEFADGTVWDQAFIDNLVRPSLTGTSGNDHLVGTNGDDRVFGLGGNDQLSGLAGRDLLDGGVGADHLLGGAGDDRYVIDDVDDVVTEMTDEGTDTVQSSVATTLGLNVENLALTGTAIISGTGNGLDNLLIGNGAANVLMGGAGNDTYVIGADDMVVEQADQGIDTVVGAASTTLGPNLENLTISSSRSVRGVGNELGNILSAPGSISTLAGGLGNDLYVLGPGDDPDVMVEMPGGGVDTVRASRSVQLPDHIERLELVDPLLFNVTDSNPLNNLRFPRFQLADRHGNPLGLDGIGNASANTLLGSQGNNRLDGGLGADTMIGGQGNDTYVVDHIGDVVMERPGEGLDQVVSSVSYALSEHVEHLRLVGMTAINATGNALANDVIGNDADNVLDGGAGPDRLSGGGGRDTYLLQRGMGQDLVFDTSSVGDVDTVQVASDIAPDQVKLIQRVDDLVITINGTEDELLLAGFFSHVSAQLKDVHFADGTVWESGFLRANAANTAVSVTGSPNNETLRGDGGNDTLIGDAGDDILSGGLGDDILYGDGVFSISVIDGKPIAGNDVLRGGPGDDLITDHLGTNLFDGGAGNDSLLLGSGQDTVLFGRGSGSDQVRFDGNGADLDIIQLAADLTPADIELTRDDSIAPRVMLRIRDTGEQLTLNLSMNYPDIAPTDIQGRIQFADGTQWSLRWSSVDLTVGTLGNDVLEAAFPSVLQGFSGDDDYRLGSAGVSGSFAVIEAAGEGIDTVQSMFDATLDANVEHLILSEVTSSALPNPERGTGNELDNIIIGNTADNILDGGAGNDVLVGGLFYLEQDHHLVGGNGSDILIGGDGDDTLIPFVPNTREAGFMNLNNGFDFGKDFIVHGQFTHLLPNDPDDMLLGGVGNDTYIIFNAAETLFEAPEEGIDIVKSLVDYTLGDNLENLTLLGNIDGPSATHGTGNALANVLIGNLAGNRLTGEEGDDTLWGGRGPTVDDEIIPVSAGNDLLIGGAGSDTYLFNLGDGTDTIQDVAIIGEGNRIQFGMGIVESDLTFTRDESARTLTIHVGNNGTDRLILRAFDPTTANGSLVVETLAFADGNTASLALLLGGPVNHAPTVANPLAGQAVLEDVALSIQIPVDTFVDPDVHDVLAYSAGSVDGAALPSWLMFDAETRTFTGTPDDAQVGSLDLKITATDSGNLSVSDVFTLTVQNVNEAPTAANPIADQTVWEDAPLSITVPVNTFADPDTGDTLTYSASLANSDALPTWLSFNPTTRTFSGMPDDAQVGTFNLAVTATDRGDLSATSLFALTVQNVNEAPVVANLVVDQTATQGTLFNFVVPANTFADIDPGDTLAYSARLANGNPLPAWLTFNPTTRTFTGTPQAGDVGAIDVRVSATDTGALSGNDVFTVTIAPSGGATAGNDTLIGTPGNDTIDGLAGDDVFQGLAGSDTLLGGFGNDLLDGGVGADTMTGGAGNDTYIIDAAGDVVTELTNEGIDTVQSSIAYTLGANLEHLTLTGTAAITGTGNVLDNVLIGNSANNRLIGRAGNDTLDGGAGNDTMVGGTGNDTYVVDVAGDVVTERLRQGIDTVQSSVTYTLAANVENLTLMGIAAINGSGNALDNTLIGNSAANILSGGAGNDTYNIGAGDTVVETANNGRDTVLSDVTTILSDNIELLVLTGTDAINGVGNRSANAIIGNHAANVLDGGTGADVMAGFDGNDTYIVDNINDVIVELANHGIDSVQSGVTSTLAANVEHLTLTGTRAINGTGNMRDNILTGNSAVNVLTGGDGNDSLRGNGGNDTLIGGNDNDTFLIGRGEGQDLLRDSSGTADTLLYDAGITPLDLMISRQVNDLRLSIHGSTDSVTLQNWYVGTTNRMETIQAGNGSLLLSTQVDQLIQAMASFNQQTGLTWDQAIDQRPQDVQTILAANWQ